MKKYGDYVYRDRVIAHILNMYDATDTKEEYCDRLLKEVDREKGIREDIAHKLTHWCDYCHKDAISRYHCSGADAEKCEEEKKRLTQEEIRNERMDFCKGQAAGVI